MVIEQPEAEQELSVEDRRKRTAYQALVRSTGWRRLIEDFFIQSIREFKKELVWSDKDGIDVQVPRHSIRLLHRIVTEAYREAGQPPPEAFSALCEAEGVND